MTDLFASLVCLYSESSTLYTQPRFQALPGFSFVHGESLGTTPLHGSWVLCSSGGHLVNLVSKLDSKAHLKEPLESSRVGYCLVLEHPTEISHHVAKAQLVSSPDLIWRVYRLQYNARY